LRRVSHSYPANGWYKIAVNVNGIFGNGATKVVKAIA
jgi:hypothetical protein